MTTSPIVRELSGKEKKYGRNYLQHMVMCPRCCEAVPVKLIITEDNHYELHCRKCMTLGHKDGSLIGWYDGNKIDYGRIIEG